MRAKKFVIAAAIAVTLGGHAAFAQGVRQGTQQDTQQGAKPDQSQNSSGSEGQIRKHKIRKQTVRRRKIHKSDRKTR